MNGENKAILIKTIVYRLIALALSILISYLIMWGDDWMPGTRQQKSLFMGIGAWTVGTFFYMVFEWVWNHNLARIGQITLW